MPERLENEAAARAVAALDDVGIEIALLDLDGVIVTVNAAWERFSDANDGDPCLTGVGVNYLDVCDLAGDAPGAADVARSIRSALAGELASSDVVEIPCHSSTEQRWFDVFVAARSEVPGDVVGATVVLTPTSTRQPPPASRHMSDSSPLNDVPAADGRVAWAMVEASPDALVMCDEQGVIELVNSQAETLFGYDRIELLGRPVETLLPERFGKVHTAHRTRYRAAPEVRTMGSGLDLRARRADGTEIPVEVSLSPMLLSGELRIIAAVRDISDRVAAEAAAQQVQVGLDSIVDGLYMFDAETLRFSYANQGAGIQSGYSPAELTETMTPLHLAPAFTRREFDQLIAPLLVGSTSVVRLETVMRHRTGLDFPVDVILECPPVAGDKSRTLVAVVRDITTRVEAEQQTRIVQHAIDSVSDAVFVCDETGLEFVHVNQGAVDLHGYSRTELLDGMSPSDLAPSMPREVVSAALAKMANHPEERVRLETVGATKAGNEVPVEVMINWPLPMRADGARPVMAVVRDISERVEAEQRFRAAFGDGPVPMTLTEISPTADRVIVEANQAMSDLLGYSLDELVGMSVVDFTHPDDLEADNQATQAQTSDETSVFRDRKRYIRKDGTPVWIQLTVRVLSSSAERVITIGHSVDISSEVEAERQRSRNQATVQALSEIRSALLASTPIGDVLEAVCAKAKDLIGADWVAISSPSLNGDVISPVAFDSSETQQLIPSAMPIDDPIRAVLDGDVWSSNEVAAAEDVGQVDRDTAAEIVGPMIMVPVGTDNRIEAVLGAGRVPGGEPFTEEDIELIAGFAGSAASALQLDEARAGQQRAELLEDRERIGRDMHDIVIGSLFATGMTLQSTVGRVTDPAIVERLSTAVNAIDETIRQIRTTIYGLRSQLDWGKGNRGEILALAAEHNTTLGFEPKVVLDGPIDDASPEVIQEALATLREALTNTAKYAKATAVSVHVKADRSTLALTISDNGIGYETDNAVESVTAHGGNGIRNIGARAESLGGHTNITSAPGEGTRIEWTVPQR